MSYQAGIPTGSVPLNQDYLNIQNNFTQLNTQFSIDHVALTSTSGTPPNGYHIQVHLVPEATPAATAGYGQLYSNTVNDGINTDQELFWLTGANRNIQLTMNFVPVAATNGYTFLPGGLILQWGVLSAAATTATTVTFTGIGAIAFPNNCFNMQTTANTSSTSTNVLNITTLTKTGFIYYSTSSVTKNYFWTAIGN